MTRGHLTRKIHSGSGLNQHQAIEIRIRAERQVGRLLGQVDKNAGGRPPKNRSYRATGLEDKTLDDMGITKNQSSRWQRISDIPSKNFEASIDNKTIPLSTGRVLRDEDRRNGVPPKENVFNVPAGRVGKRRLMRNDARRRSSRSGSNLKRD